MIFNTLKLPRTHKKLPKIAFTQKMKISYFQSTVKSCTLFKLCPKRNCLSIKAKQFSTKTINVPFMGDSISEGRIIEIMKKPGDPVEVDEVVAIVETDKTSLEICSPEAGAIKEILHSVDENVKVDLPLFTIDTSQTSKPANNDRKTEITKEENKDEKTQTTEKRKNKETDDSVAEKQAHEKQDLKTNKKPAAGNYKKQNEPSNSETNVENTQNAGRNVRVVNLSRMRIKIAERLKESQNITASLTTFNKIDCSEILNMRKKYREMFLETAGVKLGLMSSFVRASTLALKRFPSLNALFDMEARKVTYHDFVDVSVAVASEKGLVVPVLRNTEKMSFADIEKGIKKFANLAREGKLPLSDMQGGTFTISNSGVYRSVIGTPIINPPQAAVLGMYGIEDTAVVVNKEIVVRPMMQVALTYDHRAIDGREAVLFLRAIKEYIEDPMTMLLM